MDESWNPEPPPEIMKINKEDMIGDTLFSKHWLFELLLKLIKKVEESTMLEHEEDMNGVESKFEELDPDFEKDLCDLWDMSVQKDVVLVLDEFNAIQIFEGFIQKFNSKYPRAVEILVGIMVNMASLSTEINSKLAKNQTLLHLLLFDVMVKMADVQSVIQVMFLLSVFISAEQSVQEEFFEFLKNKFKSKESQTQEVDLFNTFYFILENSLNASLLDVTFNLILLFIDNDDEILDLFAQDERTVDALCNGVQTRFELEASQRSNPAALETPSARYNLNKDEPSKLTTQTSQEDISTIDLLFNKFFLCLQTLSTCERGAQSLVSRASDSALLMKTFNDYLAKCLVTFDDWEIKSSHSLKASIVAESLENLVCLISVLNCVIPDQLEDTQERLLELNVKYAGFFQKLFHLCKYYLIMFAEVKIADDMEEQQAKSSSETETTTSKSRHASQFNLAKSNLNELLRNVLVLKKQNNSTLTRLIEECVSLMDESE